MRDYTDGYAARITYKWPVSGGTSKLHAACMVSVTKTALSCAGFSVDGSDVVQATPYKSYYVSAGVDKSTLDLTGESEIALGGDDWKLGFIKHWKTTVTKVDTDTNYQIDSARFLPKLVDSASPAGDFRWAPISDENPDQAAD